MGDQAFDILETFFENEGEIRALESCLMLRDFFRGVDGAPDSLTDSDSDLLSRGRQRGKESSHHRNCRRWRQKARERVAMGTCNAQDERWLLEHHSKQLHPTRLP